MWIDVPSGPFTSNRFTVNDTVFLFPIIVRRSSERCQDRNDEMNRFWCIELCLPTPTLN